VMVRSIESEIESAAKRPSIFYIASPLDADTFDPPRSASSRE
jgi:hypothetical protein